MVVIGQKKEGGKESWNVISLIRVVVVMVRVRVVVVRVRLAVVVVRVRD